MTIYPFHSNTIHPSWENCLAKAVAKINPSYLTQLRQSDEWLPGKDAIFNAFSLPLDKVNYVLFGESPYPRRESANGHAFWDASVEELWSPTGLSKKVNRATSLRNIIKMLFIAEGLLQPNHTSQEDIAKINKGPLVKTNAELFANFLKHGILLLNASLVLQSSEPRKDALAWYPFICELVGQLLEKRPHVVFILLGKIARTIHPLVPSTQTLDAEHPYNLSFITNSKVLAFFKPLHLLQK